MEPIEYCGVYEIREKSGDQTFVKYEIIISEDNDLPIHLYSVSNSSLLIKVERTKNKLNIYPRPVDSNTVLITCNINDFECAHKVAFSTSTNLELVPLMPLYDNSITNIMTSIYRSFGEEGFIDYLLSIIKHVYSLTNLIECIIYSRLSTDKLN